MKIDFLNNKQELAYILKTERDQKIWDIYSGLCNGKVASFHKVFHDVMRNEAIVELEMNQLTWRSDLEQNGFFEAVWNYDDYIIIQVLNRAGKLDTLLNDTSRYLYGNRLSFFYERTLIHPPVDCVW